MSWSIRTSNSIRFVKRWIFEKATTRKRVINSKSNNTITIFSRRITLFCCSQFKIAFSTQMMKRTTMKTTWRISSRETDDDSRHISNHFATNIQSTNESQKKEDRDTSTTFEIISIQIHLRRFDFDIVHEVCYVDAFREVCNLFSFWRQYQVSWFDDWQVDRHEQVFHMWWIKSYLKKMFECSQTSKTSLTQNANVLHESCYRIERFWFEKLTTHIKNAIDECLRIFSTHDDSMFDFFIKRLLIINCTLSFNDNRHRLKALIDIDATDYAFIDREIAQLVCNMLSMKFVSLLKSKLLIEFDDRHISSIIHVIYFKLTIELYFELIVLLLIIDFDSHSIILEKSWMNKHEIILNIIYDKLIFKSFRCNHHDNIFNQTMQIRRLKALKSNRR